MLCRAHLFLFAIGGVVADNMVDLLGAANVEKGIHVQLGAIEQQHAFFAVLQHCAAQQRFLIAGIGQPPG